MHLLSQQHKTDEMTVKVDVLIFALVLCFAWCINAATLSKVLCDAPVVAFLCADNGTFSGLSELAFISEHVFQQEPLNLPFCQSSFFGYINAANDQVVGVVLATTGIGAVSAAMCTQSLLQNGLGLVFKEMIFVGTSGYSSVIGGFNPVAPGGCEALSRPTTLAVGSVCVAAAALDMSCGMCISNPSSTVNDLPNECSRPNCDQHLSQSLFGPCTQRGSSTLASSIVAASQGYVFPLQPAGVANGTTEWWASNEAVDEFSRANPPTTPSLLSNCVEADAHQIWVGAPLDYLCREYSAQMLNTTSQSIACVVAMESVGFLQVVNSFASYSVSAAVVRAASNWDTYPMTSAGTNNLNTSLRWVQNTTYTSEENHLAFVKASYQYAVRTSNAIVLNYVRNSLSV